MPLVGKPRHEESKVEYVPTSSIYGIQRGNKLGKTDVNALSDDMKKNGFDKNQPIELTYYQKSRTTVIGEGNHRTEAAHRAGIKKVPVTVVRYNMEGEGTKVRGKEPDQFDYTPASMRPSDIGVE